MPNRPGAQDILVKHSKSNEFICDAWVQKNGIEFVNTLYNPHTRTRLNSWVCCLFVFFLPARPGCLELYFPAAQKADRLREPVTLNINKVDLYPGTKYVVKSRVSGKYTISLDGYSEKHTVVVDAQPGHKYYIKTIFDHGAPYLVWANGLDGEIECSVLKKD
jgi:hypothetical protein